MIILNTLLALIGLGLLAATARLSHRNHSLGRILSAGLAALVNQAGKRQLDLIEFRNRARLVEETVRTSTTAVEVIHRAITSTTFEVIDRLSTSERFRADARRAKTVHDTKSRSFYRSLRTTNRAFHGLANRVMDSKAKRTNQNRDSKKHGSGDQP
ncbi:hypothetical protein [Marinobacter salicampi]|uniref:hypothetical protein n=1 Tax=Marinobacter salicampi TaxID=435907 RepID=UPI0014091DBE|nr:hypothetical protein [Marinobacter salicampi]